jgi:hypothetical protein
MPDSSSRLASLFIAGLVLAGLGFRYYRVSPEGTSNPVIGIARLLT